MTMRDANWRLPRFENQLTDANWRLPQLIGYTVEQVYLIICIVTVQCRHYRNTVPVLMQFKRLSLIHVSGSAVLIYVCISVICQLHLLDLSGIQL